MFKFRLNEVLSSSSPANESDVLTMKEALQRLGEYGTPSYGMTSYPDIQMFDGMKALQKRNGLRVDGLARPGGPTEIAIKAELAKTQNERQTAGSQAVQSDFGRREPQLEESRKHRTRQGQINGKLPLHLTMGVGQNQQNQPQDVIALKNALSWTGYYPPEKVSADDPTVDDALIWGLHGFQRDFGLTRDGFSRPGGETESRINDIISPLIQLTSSKTVNPSLRQTVLERSVTDTFQGNGDGDIVVSPHARDKWEQVAQASPSAGGSTATTSVPPSLVGVDLKFIHGLEGYETKGYVPLENNGTVMENSGVTIGAGVDVGQMNAYDLNRLVTDHGLDPALAGKLKPYLGLTKNAAKTFLAANPITLSKAEAEQLSNAKYDQIAKDLAAIYDKSMKAAGRTDTFATVPPKMKTVALSVAIQHGANLPVATKRFWKTLISGNVAAMEYELRNFGPDYKNRRILEANYLTQP